MLSEVLSSLNPEPGEAFADCTVGAGGHAAAILSRLGATGWVVGIDRDATALQLAEKQLRATGFAFDLVEGHYSQLRQHLQSVGRKPEGALNGILLDLGVSSMQVDTADRGFSFLRDGPLDMRMGQNDGETAADFLARVSQEELERVLREYGEESAARRLAKAVVARRSERPLATTRHLVEVVQSVAPRLPPGRSKKIHPATRTFQAIRIAINRELDELEGLLRDLDRYVRPGGRVVVLSYHSLEDRIVKRWASAAQREHFFKTLTTRPLRPGRDEVERNPRARSARLRAMVRV